MPSISFCLSIFFLFFFIMPLCLVFYNTVKQRLSIDVLITTIARRSNRLLPALVCTPKIFFRVCLFKLWFLLTQILRNNFRFDEKIGSLNVWPPWKFYFLTVRGGKMSVNFKWCHIYLQYIFERFLWFRFERFLKFEVC